MSMSDKKMTYSKIIIEIADYIFANPQLDLSKIVSYFVPICQKSDRTVRRFVKKATEYNLNRIIKQEKVKDDILLKSTAESIKRDILSRDEALEILSSISRGNAKKIKDELIIPSASEQIRAIDKLAELNGWNMPAKIAQTDSDGNDIISGIDIRIIRTKEDLEDVE
jgi:hypothetical protein